MTGDFSREQRLQFMLNRGELDALDMAALPPDAAPPLLASS